MAKQLAVIGAGLAGLVSALKLQSEGHQVILVEQRDQVGGLCGSFDMDGHKFVIACNDFGSGLADLLKKLAVDVDFEYKKSLINYQGQWFNAAPDFDMLKKLKNDWWNLSKLIAAIVWQQTPFAKPQTIESFVDRFTSSGPVNDLAKIIAYFMGVAPSDIMTSYFALDKTYQYGYTKMACPVGGPQVLVDAIATRFQELGGEITLKTRCQDYVKTDNGYQLTIGNMDQSDSKLLQVDAIVDTTERASNYPKKTKRGLPLSMLCMAIDSKFPYPDDTHTLTYYEPNISDWFSTLDNGMKPEKFGFHVFKSDLSQDHNNLYTLNVYFYLPRGINQLDELNRAQYSEILLRQLEQLLPGIREAIRYQRLITPTDFVTRHGLSSRVMPFVHLDTKPTIETDDKNYLRAGHTIYPPGEHAGAAALSGFMAAETWIEQNKA